MVDMPVSHVYKLSDDSYDPDDPENYMDVDEMRNQVSGDDEDDEEIPVVEEEAEIE